MFKPRIKASHWYDAMGNPVHQVPYKDKKRAGELRNTTLKDARELGLVPSVTNMLNVIANPALQEWKMQQLLLAALTLPRNQGESEEEWVDRIITDSESFTAKTADLGHKIHDAIEEYLVNGTVTNDPLIKNQMDMFYQWGDANIGTVIGTEFNVVGNGYAGRVDLSCVLQGSSNPTIIDFKTRSKYRGKLAVRQQDLWQLCGYRFAMEDRHKYDIASVIIDRDDPSVPHVHVWTPDDIDRGTQVFLNARSLWHSINNVDLDVMKDPI